MKHGKTDTILRSLEADCTCYLPVLRQDAPLWLIHILISSGLIHIRTLSNQYDEENIPHFDHNCCSLKYLIYFPSHVNHVWFLPKSATSTNVSKVRKKWKIDFFSNYSCVLGWKIFAKSMDGKTSERIHSPINLRKGSKIMFFWGII